MCIATFLVKNHKIAIRSTTTEAKENITTDLESLGFLKFFDALLPTLKNNQFLLDKSRHQFLMTTKLFIG
jgi:hypothetical protein